MFKILKRTIQHVLPCYLCELQPRYQSYVVCQDCWLALPRLQQPVMRQQEIITQYAYTYPLDRILQQFKYEQKLHHLPLLQHILAELKLPRIQAIVPMPISNARLIERGYNQSVLMAHTLAKMLNVPVWQPITRLEQHAQKGLTRLERLSNIEQQFVIQQKSKICYRRVLMLDDVVTTGSSMTALRNSLMQLGCQQIYACSIAATI